MSILAAAEFCVEPERAEEFPETMKAAPADARGGELPGTDASQNDPGHVFLVVERGDPCESAVRFSLSSRFAEADEIVAEPFNAELDDVHLRCPASPRQSTLGAT